MYKNIGRFLGRRSARVAFNAIFARISGETSESWSVVYQVYPFRNGMASVRVIMDGKKNPFKRITQAKADRLLADARFVQRKRWGTVPEIKNYR